MLGLGLGLGLALGLQLGIWIGFRRNHSWSSTFTPRRNHSLCLVFITVRLSADVLLLFCFIIHAGTVSSSLWQSQLSGPVVRAVKRICMLNNTECISNLSHALFLTA